MRRQQSRGLCHDARLQPRFFGPGFFASALRPRLPSIAVAGVGLCLNCCQVDNRAKILPFDTAEAATRNNAKNRYGRIEHLGPTGGERS
jgi:hypothetical protein